MHHAGAIRKAKDAVRGIRKALGWYVLQFFWYAYLVVKLLFYFWRSDVLVPFISHVARATG